MSDGEPRRRPEPTYEMVMPFVACQSQGGEYEDHAFAAGYHLGTLDEQLRTASDTFEATVRGPSFKQLDLIAMRHGWILTLLGGPEVEPADEEWVFVELARDPEGGTE